MKQGMRPVGIDQVELRDAFWAMRRRVNRTVTLALEYDQCKATGRIDAFRLAWKPGRPNQPHVFWDSDVAKWVEACAHSLTDHPDDKRVRAMMDEVVALIVSAQQPDGYINTHFTSVAPTKRWSNLRDLHELYCAGHLMEAAVAHHRATGDTKLLDALCRFADYIGTVFGEGKGQKRGYPGHEEIELALVKLYRATGERRYLDLATYFVNERGRQPHYYDIEARARGEDIKRYHDPTYAGSQSHLPVREQTTAEGHAVRAMYLYSGMVDVAVETGDKTLLTACRRLWRDVTRNKMYITGGVGSSRFGERFTVAHDLPNEDAYAETCAAIGLAFFAHRMLQAQADAQYADVMERALYNGVSSGLALDGKTFFYVNPLAVHPPSHLGQGHATTSRQPWFGTSCCPPNIARLLASLGQYVASTQGKALYVHLYGRGRIDSEVGAITVDTDYPWDGRIAFTVERDGSFTLALRLPGWCAKPTLAVNGKRWDANGKTRKGYALLKRDWRAGDSVTLTLPMPVERIEAHPAVRSNCGRVALQRGPIVYCLEQVDNGSNLNDIVLPRAATLKARHDPSLLGGVTVITGKAKRRDARAWKDALYQPQGRRDTAIGLTAVPYCVWANRKPGEMLVWIRSD